MLKENGMTIIESLLALLITSFGMLSLLHIKHVVIKNTEFYERKVKYNETHIDYPYPEISAYNCNISSVHLEHIIKCNSSKNEKITFAIYSKTP